MIDLVSCWSSSVQVSIGNILTINQFSYVRLFFTFQLKTVKKIKFQGQRRNKAWGSGFKLSYSTGGGRWIEYGGGGVLPTLRPTEPPRPTRPPPAGNNEYGKWVV